MTIVPSMFSVNMPSDGEFPPEVVLPSQYYGKRYAYCCAERALVQAVLESALHDLVVYTGNPHPVARHYVREVRLWMSGDYETEGFEFSWVCQCLGLDADAVRKAVL